MRLVLGVVLFVAAGGAALADCTPVTSDLDRYGVAELGRTAPRVMDAHASRTAECEYRTAAYCIYRDKKGVRYGLIAGILEWKELRLSHVDPRSVPLGLAATDTPEVVRRKMKLRGITLTDSLGAKRADGSDLSSDFCLINAKHETFNATFSFNAAGHLETFGTNLPGPPD